MPYLNKEPEWFDPVVVAELDGVQVYRYYPDDEVEDENDYSRWEYAIYKRPVSEYSSDPDIVFDIRELQRYTPLPLGETPGDHETALLELVERGVITAKGINWDAELPDPPDTLTMELPFEADARCVEIAGTA